MRIFLVRHGESIANINPAYYAELQDHNVPLSQWGHEQALEAGNALKAFFDEYPDIQSKPILLFHSPYLRTRQTMDGLLEGLGETQAPVKIREDFLLRERDYGLFNDIRSKKDRDQKLPYQHERFNTLRAKDGKFFASPPLGESYADLALRTRLFKQDVMRAYHEGVENIVVVGHGEALHTFMMDFFHKGIKWFENTDHMKNCEIVLIEGDTHKGFTHQSIHTAKKRPQHLSSDHKTAPHIDEKTPGTVITTNQKGALSAATNVPQSVAQL